MLSFFKSSKKKIPQRNNDFYERENLIQTVNELNTCLKRLGSLKTTKTNSNILFQGFELDVINEKNLKKDFGNESYYLKSNSGINNHKIYFYRIAYKDLKLLLQLHFIEDMFFFAATKIYSDILLTNADKQTIINQIISKYQSNIDSQSFDIEIMDPNGNILFTQDNVYFYVKYLANNITSQKLKKEYAENNKTNIEINNVDNLDNII